MDFNEERYKQLIDQKTVEGFREAVDMARGGYLASGERGLWEKWDSAYFEYVFRLSHNKKLSPEQERMKQAEERFDLKSTWENGYEWYDSALVVYTLNPRKSPALLVDAGDVAFKIGKKLGEDFFIEEAEDNYFVARAQGYQFDKKPMRVRKSSKEKKSVRIGEKIPAKRGRPRKDGMMLNLNC